MHQTHMTPEQFDRWLRAQEIIRTGQGCRAWRNEVGSGDEISRFAMTILNIVAGLVILAMIAAALVR